MLLDAALRKAADPGLRADIARLQARVEWNTGPIISATPRRSTISIGCCSPGPTTPAPPVMILYSLARLGFAQLPMGRWSEAAAGEAEALRLAASTGQPGLAALPLAMLTLLAALRGDDAYDGHLAAVEEVTSARPLGIVDLVIRDLIRWAKGVRSVARPATAAAHLAQISHGMVRRMAALGRLETAFRADLRDDAASWTAELERFADATGAAWAAAAAAHETPCWPTTTAPARCSSVP